MELKRQNRVATLNGSSKHSKNTKTKYKKWEWMVLNT